MINKCFFDLDECLIFSDIHPPNQSHVSFSLKSGGTYYTIIRPCAKHLIEYARNLVGQENVYILTSSTTDYAREINRLAEFEFPDSHIIAREDLVALYFPTAYGGGTTLPSKFSHVDNVLIDNLNPRYNQEKISFLGIWKSVDTNYLQIRDYYGVNFPDDMFEQKVMEFLNERTKSPSLCKQEGEKENLEIPFRIRYED